MTQQEKQELLEILDNSEVDVTYTEEKNVKYDKNLEM